MSRYPSLTWAEARSESPSRNDAEIDQLIQNCLAGNEAAYRLLYERHASLVYRLAYSLLQQREDAEEVMQDSFEYAFRKLSNYDARQSAFTTWLYRITVSRCRNKRRRKRFSILPLSKLAPSGIEDENAPLPDLLIERSETQQAVWDALRDLSPKLLETAVLRYFYGLRYQEIGEILGISPKTAESRMRLAHQKLRDSLTTGEESA
ncbi:MAG: RNA polymerase sigma factor [Candidatus Promineifilaceae bacterium]